MSPFFTNSATYSPQCETICHGRSLTSKLHWNLKITWNRMIRFGLISVVIETRNEAPKWKAEFVELCIAAKRHFQRYCEMWKVFDLAWAGHLYRTKKKWREKNINKWPSIANNLVNICCVSWNKLEKLWNVHFYKINAILKIANGSLKTDRQIQSGLVKQWLIFDEPISVYCHVEVVYVNIKKPIKALSIRFQVISERVAKKNVCQNECQVNINCQTFSSKMSKTHIQS